MSTRTREEVVRELHDRGCGCGKGDCDAIEAIRVGFAAGRLAEREDVVGWLDRQVGWKLAGRLVADLEAGSHLKPAKKE